VTDVQAFFDILAALGFVLGAAAWLTIVLGRRA
jgi:hypothetical protein